MESKAGFFHGSSGAIYRGSLGQLLDVLLSKEFVEKKYQYLAGASPTQAVRLRVIESKATAHVNRGAKKQRLLAKAKLVYERPTSVPRGKRQRSHVIETRSQPARPITESLQI